ncbi:MAG: metallophosphoesterase family protein [Bacteroidia bacterium]|nr:metallophosphoesterase family protein [Bacteroidia bacterium]
MKIAILSDIHDHIWNLNVALKHMEHTHTLLVAGDLCSPFVVNLLARQYTKPIHLVFGNNDGDLYRITQNAAHYGHVKLHGEWMQSDFSEKRVAMNHYPEIAAVAAACGQFDLVVYGHNHHAMQEQSEGRWLVNPGTLMGYDPVANVDVPATYAVYDTATAALSFYEVRGHSIVAFHTRNRA